jgi:hypothetical protein
MSTWKTVTALSEVEPARKSTGHSWYSPAKIGWLTYCLRCGNVLLNNGISRLIQRAGCDYARTTQYQAWIRSGRKPL